MVMANVQHTPVNGRRCSNWLATYASYTENTEAPREFHLWTAVSTIAASLNRKCWINMGSFNIYPSLYIIFVAPPGIATKSTTARIGEDLLVDAESIHLGASSMTWQAMLDELQEAAKAVEFKPGEPMVTMSALHIFASELGTFLQMGDAGMIDTLVDLWDGKDNFKRRTRGSGIVQIPRPYINLLGCTTPGWLSANAESYFIDGGFFSRTLFVYADQKDRLIAYPEDTFDYSVRKDLLHDLERISELKGEFTLDREAQAWGIKWYEDTYTSPPEHLRGDKFQAYLSRRQSHLHKIAMCVSAAERSDQTITLSHLQVAEGMLTMAEMNLVQIYDSIVTDDKIGAYKRVKQTIRAHKTSSKSALFRELAHRLSISDFEDAIRALTFSGEIKTRQQGNKLIVVWNG